MEIIGDRSLIHDLHYKEILGRNGIRRRRILIGTPGLKAGVVDAKRKQAMADIGITADRFDVVVGSSASSWNGAAYCAGQAHIVADVYAHLCEIRFLFPTWWGDWMNLEYLVRLLRGQVSERWRLDQQAIRDGTTQLLIGLSDIQGKLSLENAQHFDDVLDLCLASSSPPLVMSGKPVGGVLRYDGGCADPCPVRRVLRHTVAPGEEVDVLVIASRPETTNVIEAWAFWTLAHCGLAFFPASFRASTATMDLKILRLGEMIRKKRKTRRFRLCAVFPTGDECVFPLEWRADAVQEGGNIAYGNYMRFLEKNRPHAHV